MVKKEEKKKSALLNRLSIIDRRLKNIEDDDKKIRRSERKVRKELKKLNREEESIEKSIMKFGRINFKRKHLFEIVRASAGAFLGVGLGRGLLGLDSLAKTLPWLNIIGILVFILIISGLLIFKSDKGKISNKGVRVLFARLMFIYLISIFIEFLSLLLFNVSFDNFSDLTKILIVGSFTAMGSAVSFSL